MNNPYKTLGVEENADDIQIKKAYKKLAMQHHPDKGGDADKFRQIAEAYENLSDPSKKKIYDMNITINYNFLNIILIEFDKEQSSSTL